MRIEIVVPAENEVGEGPFWDDREGRLWWVDIAKQQVLAWRPGENGAQRWDMPDFVSGVVTRASGGMLVAMRSGLFFWDPEQHRLEPFVAPDADRPHNRSNEAKTDPVGNFWLGTMQNNLHEDGTSKPMTDATGALYCVRPDGRWTLEVDRVGLSNTLAWTADGRTLFGDTKTGVISSFATGSDRCLSDRRVFTDQANAGHCDGSAIDSAGFLWNARFGGSRLIRFTPNGAVDREIMLPVSQPTSCCFGGNDLCDLYVTSARCGLSADALRANPAEGAVLRLKAEAPGVPSFPFAG